MQGTRSYGIHYVVDFELDLVGFIDSDWVGDRIDQMSTSAYVFKFGSGTSFYSSKKQEAISLSSIELEYRGAVNACFQEVWMKGILAGFDIGSTTSTIIFCDNQSAIKILIDMV